MEENNKPKSQEPSVTSWDNLNNFPLEDTLIDEAEAARDRAYMYRNFGKVKDSLEAIDAISSADISVDYAELLKEPESIQAKALLNQINNALADVDKSLDNQIDYGIINHKHINTKEALEKELRSGTSIPELDIRFDSDGKPWISHSSLVGIGTFLPKQIHKTSSEKITKGGKRLSLEEGLDIFNKYYEDNKNHKIVFEIKELGNTRISYIKYLNFLKSLLDKRGLTDVVIFSTLSPSILKAIHDVFPENSKILNGGIAPIISYDLAKNSTKEETDKEYTVRLPGIELFLSSSSEIKDHGDGYGKQTGYLWTRLPRETIAALKEMNKKGKIGTASLTIVNVFANVLEKLSPKTADRLRFYYADQLKAMGIGIQTSISNINPKESTLEVKERMGEDTIIYTDTSPGDWSTDLPSKDPNPPQ